MGIDIAIKTGRRIRYLRTLKGIRQSDMADWALLSRESLSRIENGKVEPGLRTLHRIAQALGVKLAELMEGLD